MQLREGTILQKGKYRIEKVLGQGSFGITYLATTKVKLGGNLGDMEAVVKVAVKEFFMRDLNGREGSTVTYSSRGELFDKYKKKFIKEAQNLSRLSHPNIIKVLDLFEANGTYYYVMKYCECGSLDERIRRSGGLSESETLRYSNQIGSALGYMHSKKMLHLDLKPGNIMLDDKGNAVLIDFGLSKQFDNRGEPESSTTIGLGTPGYAPIEQSTYEGEGFPVTMDIYAFGATMYKMLTGKSPNPSSEMLNVGFPYEELRDKGVSEKLIEIISLAMKPMVKDRYQSVEELLREMECMDGFNGRKCHSEDTLEEKIKSNKIRLECTRDNGYEMSKERYSDVYLENSISFFFQDYSGKLKMLDTYGVINIPDNFVVYNNCVLNVNYVTLGNLCSRTKLTKLNCLPSIIDELNLRSQMLRSSLVVAYDETYLDYLDVIKYLVKIFGFIPQGIKIISYLKLAAYCCGAMEMKCLIGNECNLVYIERGLNSCVIDAGDDVIEIKDNQEVLERITKRYVIEHDTMKDVIAGCALWFQHKILLIDVIDFDVSVGIFPDKPIVFVDKYTIIPTRKYDEIEKGYADKLYINYGNARYVWQIDEVFRNDIRLNVTVDVDSLGMIVIIISSDNHRNRCNISFSDILQI